VPAQLLFLDDVLIANRNLELYKFRTLLARHKSQTTARKTTRLTAAVVLPNIVETKKLWGTLAHHDDDKLNSALSWSTDVTTILEYVLDISALKPTSIQNLILVASTCDTGLSTYFTFQFGIAKSEPRRREIDTVFEASTCGTQIKYTVQFGVAKTSKRETNRNSNCEVLYVNC